MNLCGEDVAPPLKLIIEGRHGFNREVVAAESGPAPPWRPTGLAPPLQLADPASLQPRNSPTHGPAVAASSI